MKKLFLLGCLAYTQGALAVAAPKQVVVGPEDTVYGIAYDQGVPTRSVISANNLQPPYVLSPGQTLVIPAANEHIAGTGETLQSIADTYGVNVDVLAHENNFFPAYIVKRGDVLMIPARDTESIAETLMTPAPEIAEVELAPLPSVKQAPPRRRPTELPSDIAKELANEQFEKKPPPPPEKKEEKKKEKPFEKKEELPQEKVTQKEETKELKEPLLKPKETSAQKKKAEKKEPEKPKLPETVSFVWPVKGKIIKDFKAGSHDGIVIQVDEETPVKAAAAGEVIYVGSEIKSLGKLILIKHPQAFVTAYAHLSETLAKKGEKVKKGAVIAHSGTAKGSSVGQLHFEIREGKKPINPLDKLKGSTK